MTVRFLVHLVDLCRRHPVLVLLAGATLAALSGSYARDHTRVSTDTDRMFPESLAWRQRALAFDREFPQFQDLIVAVVDARIPEEADATARALAERALASERFRSVRRPNALPFFEKYGLLLLNPADLTRLMDQTIDAQPFLGQLVSDPSARGLFAALALLGMGVTKDDANVAPYLTPLRGFHEALRDVVAGSPRPLSWQSLLGGETAELAGPYRFVLLQPRLDKGALQAGGNATRLLRDIIPSLEFVEAGSARVRLTGAVPIADEEFATVAAGAIEGMVISLVLVIGCLFLAVWTWRLIVPIVLTLLLGLLLTLLFAAVTLGTLNVISVGFGILFLGMAVDFGIQFAVRFREYRLRATDVAAAMALTARLAGPQILLAAITTAAGFLAFLPTDFAGVAELGWIAGGGMLIAFACSVTFLPAAITLFRPRGEREEVGFAWAGRCDPIVVRWRWPILGASGAIVALGLALIPSLHFDADPLRTKDQNTEAVRTLRELIERPLTNPYTAEILLPDEAALARVSEVLRRSELVSGTRGLLTFMPADQDEKLALIGDAFAILAPTLGEREAPPPITPEDIRIAARAALAQIDPALVKLPTDHPLADVARDLRALQVADDPVLMTAQAALTRFLPDQLGRLRASLSAEAISRDTLPAELRRDWVASDGRLRLQVNATREALARGAIRDFAAAVRAVAPDAVGPALKIDATTATITGAFRDAAFYALVSIAVILFIARRRVLDVLLVMAPLSLSALFTLVVVVAGGLNLNFANIIALPLLLGVGVSYNVYFVMNWREGLGNPLGSATMRGVLFSALTTATAFGALALSRHPGTASMGFLLLISLGCTLVGSFVFLPALLAAMGRPGGETVTEPR